MSGNHVRIPLGPCKKYASTFSTIQTKKVSKYKTKTKIEICSPLYQLIQSLTKSQQLYFHMKFIFTRFAKINKN